jgi:hypothetical protein
VNRGASARTITNSTTAHLPVRYKSLLLISTAYPSPCAAERGSMGIGEIMSKADFLANWGRFVLTLLRLAREEAFTALVATVRPNPDQPHRVFIPTSATPMNFLTATVWTNHWVVLPAIPRFAFRIATPTP